MTYHVTLPLTIDPDVFWGSIPTEIKLLADQLPGYQRLEQIGVGIVAPPESGAQGDNQWRVSFDYTARDEMAPPENLQCSEAEAMLAAWEPSSHIESLAAVSLVGLRVAGGVGMSITNTPSQSARLGAAYFAAYPDEPIRVEGIVKVHFPDGIELRFMDKMPSTIFTLEPRRWWHFRIPRWIAWRVVYDEATDQYNAVRGEI